MLKPRFPSILTIEGLRAGDCSEEHGGVYIPPDTSRPSNKMFTTKYNNKLRTTTSSTKGAS
jgi:hypothetical protein